MPRKSIYFDHLNKKWTSRHRRLQKQLFKSHKESFDWFLDNSRQFAVGTLAGIFLLTSPAVTQVPVAFSSSQSAQPAQTIDKRVFLVYDLKHLLPQEVQPLTTEQEKAVSEVLTRDFGFSVVSELDGKKLNRAYGLIGQEQHLKRFPGDTMYTHFESPQNANEYWKYGMAQGLGAYGYFAKSESAMTKTDIQREKYYIAVQTFLAPGFNNDPKAYNEFFKYRKMLVVNPQNGKAIVADIADAGPAQWTGKQLGGSPEVMRYLGRYDGAQRGPVLYFFIDDPNDTIPLGPVNNL